MIPYGDIPLVSCRGLQFKWPGSDATLKMDDFCVAPGERMFLCGPSGSGKSTLLGLLSGVLRATSGEVTILGVPFSTLSAPRRDHFRAEHLGYIFQQFNLLPFLSPVENVLLGCTWSRVRAIRAGATRRAQRAEAIRLLDALGLVPQIIERAHTGNLSVGQQQRVAVARALIGGPQLLIADEPTSALDEDNRDLFLRLLLAECTRHGTGVVFVSHDITLARHFDRAVTLGERPPSRMVAWL
jgi:putative ABC transport system ATP-binding protein